MDPTSVVVTSDGHILVADGRFVGWNKILVYDRAGQFLQSFGREGQGPCEFTQLWWAHTFAGDSIAAFDAADHSLVVFGPDGTCAREVPLPRRSVEPPPGTFLFDDLAEGVFEDGSVLVILMGRLDISAGPGIVSYDHGVLRVATNGAISDSVGIFAFSQAGWTGTAQKSAPLTLRALLHVTDNAFYYGNGSTYEVYEYANSGTLKRIIRREYLPQPVRSEHRQEYLDWATSLNPRSAQHDQTREQRIRSLEEEAIWPTQLPPFSALLVDSEGYLWVENYRWFDPTSVPTNPPATIWSVFDPSGRWLGEIEVPGQLLISSVATNQLTGVWKKSDGSSEIRLYALTRSVR
jgi:hypothetical protein